jgi:hypothetical protein
MRIKTNKFLIKTNRFAFILLTSLFGVLLNLILSYIFLDLLKFNLATNPVDTLPQNLKFVNVVFMGPLIETAIFQYFLIVFILKIIIKTPSKIHYIFFTSFSALLFALTHTYGILYFSISLIFGLYYGYVTILSEFIREKKVNVFISVGGGHALINLVTFLFE